MRVTEIFYLVTASEYRGWGIGVGLVNHALTYIERRYSCGTTARVREANAPIIALLTRLGFSPHPTLTSQPDWVV